MRTVFLDRDGVINANRADHVKSWSEFHFLPGALEALALLANENFKVFIITNQAIINRGIVSHSVVDDINRRMVQAVQEYKGKIEAVLYCPHRPEENCGCRKPKPGLLYEAAKVYVLDLSQCHLVGDAISDITAGLETGCRSILVLTGRGAQQLLSWEARRLSGYMVAQDLQRAARHIIREEMAREAAPPASEPIGTQRKPDYGGAWGAGISSLRKESVHGP